MKVQIIFRSSTRPLVLRHVEDIYKKMGMYCFQLRNGFIRRWPCRLIWEITSKHQPHWGNTRVEGKE